MLGYSLVAGWTAKTWDKSERPAPWPVTIAIKQGCFCSYNSALSDAHHV